MTRMEKIAATIKKQGPAGPSAMWLEDRVQKNYSCSVEEWKALRSLAGSFKESPVNFYQRQKYNAERRGIEWQLTLPEWWSIWQQSGKWKQRGIQGHNYVMSRFKDEGPYAVGNVRIITVTENLKEYYALYGDEHCAIQQSNWDKRKISRAYERAFPFRKKVAA